jgi:hypothetical protein
MRFGANRVAQGRDLLPEVCRAAKRLVDRFQHAGSSLLDNLGQVAHGLLGIAQARLARLGQGKKCEGADGKDQQDRKSRDQVEKQTLGNSRAVDWGRKLRYHGNRSEITVSSVPRKFHARDASVYFDPLRRLLSWLVRHAG